MVLRSTDVLKQAHLHWGLVRYWGVQEKWGRWEVEVVQERRQVWVWVNEI